MDTNKKILIVDDFATMRRIVRGSLKQLGFTHVMEAEDGKKAFSLLKKNNIDLVLADWNMPNMNGLELLKAVRSDEKLKELPFVMITAEGLKDNIIEAVNSGVSNYIVKPFTPDILEDKLKKVLG